MHKEIEKTDEQIEMTNNRNANSQRKAISNNVWFFPNKSRENNWFHKVKKSIVKMFLKNYLETSKLGEFLNVFVHNYYTGI